MSGAAPTTSPARRREPEGHRGRVLPYTMREILPRVMRGERVLVAAHGNSLRALVMVLDGLTTETIPGLELHTGVPLVYHLKDDTTVASKEVLNRD